MYFIGFLLQNICAFKLLLLGIIRQNFFFRPLLDEKSVIQKLGELIKKLKDISDSQESTRRGRFPELPPLDCSAELKYILMQRNREGGYLITINPIFAQWIFPSLST